MVKYDNEFETTKITFKPRVKSNHNIYNTPGFLDMIRPRDYQAVRYFTSNIPAESKHTYFDDSLNVSKNYLSCKGSLLIKAMPKTIEIG